MHFRNALGRFSKRFDLTDKIGISFIILFSLFIALMTLMDATTKEIHATRLFAPKAEADEIDRLDVKIDQLKNEVLDTLAKCESGGLKSEDGILVWDTNAKHSVGEFQFQVATVKHYVKKLWGKDVSGRDAILIALDPEQSRKLAHDVIFTTSNGVAKDWVVCSRNYQLQSKVDLIKSLTI